MKTFLILLILLNATLIIGQTTPENVILLLDGGQTNVDVTFYWQLLSGGQNIGFTSAGPWDIWSNPASLVSFKKSYFSIGVGPALLGSADDFTDVDAEIKAQVSEKIKDYRSKETFVIFPKIKSQFGQHWGLVGSQLAYPFKLGKIHHVLSFDVGQPFVLNLKAKNNGLTTMIETRKEVGDQDKVIHMRLNTLLNANISLKATKYRVGLARQISEKLATGFGLGQTFVKLHSNIAANIEGMMETAGSEYAFNDPYDPRIDFEAGETNRLDQSVLMDFDGSSFNFDIGLLYKMSNSWVVGTSASINSKTTLTGNMDVNQYKIPALNADALFEEGNEDDLVNPTKLNLAKLTLTEPVQNKETDSIDLNFPNALGIQLSYQKPIFETTFSFRPYFGEFGYTFLDNKYYFDLSYDVSAEIVWGFLKLAVGGTNGRFVQMTSDGEESSDGWVPHGALEINSYLLSSFYFSAKLFVEPTPGVAVKVGYFF
jgi:hypothetical protein